MMMSLIANEMVWCTRGVWYIFEFIFLENEASYEKIVFYSFYVFLNVV